MLTSIKIEKLFDIFDYDIKFKKEGITILTGPNGYGKTTVLKILDALAWQNGFFFIRLLFKKIILEFSDKDAITLEKNNNDISITIGKSEPTYLSIISFETTLHMIAKGTSFLEYVSEDRWIDLNTDSIYNTETALQKYFPSFTVALQKIGLPKFTEVYFIREQRLLRPLPAKPRPRGILAAAYSSYQESDAFSKTIEEYGKELRENIKETLAKSSQITQELDSSFPRRLFDQLLDISELEFNQRFGSVKSIQKALNEYGLSDIKEDTHPTYKKANAKALCVYIEDTERKLAIFSELLRKLEIFTDILNERRFSFKRIDISKEDGFKFSTSHGKSLALGDLSSGEQQEVVLLYELLFKVQPGTLVLIDEPELSLHVVWQKQFLDDLLKIIELQKINVIIATHSPQIINNRWDLTVDLEENFQCESI
jgi:predicted ATP-binding protein involved in virulence